MPPKSYDVTVVDDMPEAAFNAFYSSSPEGVSPRNTEYTQWLLHNCNARTLALTHNQNEIVAIAVVQQWNDFACIGVLDTRPSVPLDALNLFVNAVIDYASSVAEWVGLHLSDINTPLLTALILADVVPVEPHATLSTSFNTLKENKNMPESSTPYINICYDMCGATRYGEALRQSGRGELIAQQTESGELAYALCLETAPRTASGTQEPYVLVTHGVVPRMGDVKRMEHFIATAINSVAPDTHTVYLSMNMIYAREIKQLVERGWHIRKMSHRLIRQKDIPRYKQIVRTPQIDLSNWQL